MVTGENHTTADHSVLDSVRWRKINTHTCRQQNKNMIHIQFEIENFQHERFKLVICMADTLWPACRADDAMAIINM